MQRRNAPSVLLASGGLDSTTLAYWMLKRKMAFIPLFVHYGQHCAKTERETLRDVLPTSLHRTIREIDIADVYRGTESRLIRKTDLWRERITADDLYLPYRNILLIAAASAYAQARGYRRVFAGFINSNHAKEIDCSAKFFARLGQLLSDYGSVVVEMPFRQKSKFQVAKIGIKLAAPIGRTFSCQVSARVPCGACPNCVDRLEALRKLPRR